MINVSSSDVNTILATCCTTCNPYVDYFTRTLKLGVVTGTGVGAGAVTSLEEKSSSPQSLRSLRKFSTSELYLAASKITQNRISKSVLFWLFLASKFHPKFSGFLLVLITKG